MNNWTIGYITNGQQNELLALGVQSVRREVPDAEIIIVGGDGKIDCDTYVPFDESQMPRWITRKKNIIAQHASYDNICLMHDYVMLCDSWLQANDDFGYDWLTCMHRVLNNDGARYRDWCVIYNDAYMKERIDNVNFPPGEGRMLNYSTRGHERWQYYSGTYFCSKREILLNVPLNERLTAGAGEDVEWSREIYRQYGPEVFQINEHASVKLLKKKPHVKWQSEPCL